VHDFADFVGYSLGLSMEAAKTGADVIVFCGVYFMAETAKILSPGKTFYPVSDRAVCPNMKLTNLEKVLWSLEDMRYEVRVPEKIMERARHSIQRMLDH
jgi:quinolinate synthase